VEMDMLRVRACELSNCKSASDDACYTTDSAL
jgi:hypothetical protein